MGFIGVQPATVPLTSSDITDGIISTAKISDDAVDNTKLDLTDNYAFTGTITGASDIVLLATSNSTSTVTEVDITLPTGYDNYLLHTMIKGDHTGSSTKFGLQIKLDGESSFITSNYSTQGELLDNGTRVNDNSGASNIILYHSSASDMFFSSQIFLDGFGRTDVASNVSCITSKGLNGSASTWVTGGSHTTEATALAKVVEIRVKPVNGNFVHAYYKLYGLN